MGVSGTAAAGAAESRLLPLPDSLALDPAPPAAYSTVNQPDRKRFDMVTPLEGTASAAGAVARVSYTHDAMIDLIIGCPGISNNDLAKHFGYTPPWVSRIKNSDAFQERLSLRKAEIVDPALTLSVEEKLRDLAHRGLDVLAEKMSAETATIPTDTALKVVELSARALGYGARGNGQTNVQNNFVVALPGKAGSEDAWATACTPGGVLGAPGAAFPSSTPAAG